MHKLFFNQIRPFDVTISYSALSSTCFRVRQGEYRLMFKARIVAASIVLAISGCSPADKNAAKAEDAMDKKFGSDAGIACAFRADDYLRSIARYDFAWDDDAKGYSDKFTKYSIKSPGIGMMTIVSDKAKLSNGFGAFEHITIYCLYNAATDEVVRFSDHDPYLDTLKQTTAEDNHSAAGSRSESPITIYDAENAANVADPTSDNTDVSTETVQQQTLEPSNSAASDKLVGGSEDIGSQSLTPTNPPTP
jgi:hypothetical protein